jgi:excisionase family DNA binding protein
MAEQVWRPGDDGGEDPAEPGFDGCRCHVCNTLRSVLSANRDAPSDTRVATPLLLTFGQAAELLGVSDDTVRTLVHEGEIRSVTIQSYGGRRIPRAELDDYISRLITGQLRAWVEARRDLDQWGLRYMGDHRTYTNKRGIKTSRTVAWHLGDGKSTLCGKEPVGRWEVTTRIWSWTRLCDACEAIRDRIRLEMLEKRRRPPPAPAKVCPMLTVVEYPGSGRAIRRKGWHLGDGKTTLCGLTRETWELPGRRPRSAGCPTCQQRAGVAAGEKSQPRRLV